MNNLIKRYMTGCALSAVVILSPSSLAASDTAAGAPADIASVLQGTGLSLDELSGAVEMGGMSYDTAIKSETQAARGLLEQVGFQKEFFQGRFPCKQISPFTIEKQQNFVRAIAMLIGFYRVNPHGPSTQGQTLEQYVTKGMKFALGAPGANNPNTSDDLSLADQLVQAVLVAHAADTSYSSSGASTSHHASTPTSPSTEVAANTHAKALPTLEMEDAPEAHEIVAAVGTVDPTAVNDPVYAQAVLEMNRGLKPMEHRDTPTAGRIKTAADTPFFPHKTITSLNEHTSRIIGEYLLTIQNYSLPPHHLDAVHGVYDGENSNKGSTYRVYYFDSYSKDFLPHKVRIARALDYLVAKKYITDVIKMAYLAAL